MMSKCSKRKYKRYLIKKRIYTELRTFEKIDEPIVKIEISQNYIGKIFCKIYLEDGSYIYL